MTTEKDQRNEIIEPHHWQSQVNAALAELLKPLISVGISIEEITHEILAQGKRLTGSEHGYVSYIDPISKDMFAYTMTEMLKGQCTVKRDEKPIVFPIGKDGRYHALWGHSLNECTPMYTNSPQQHPSSKGIPSGHVPLKRFLSVPVILEDELVGQIALANPSRDYNHRDLETVQRLGEFYALAIQQRRAEEKLRGAKEKYQKLFEEAIDGIVLTDPDTGIILDCNSVLCKLVRRKKSELIGQHQRILHPPEDQNNKFSSTFQNHPGKESSQILEGHLITKDGKIKTVDSKAKCYKMDGKRMLQVVFHDTTERKQMELELRKYQDHLEELVKKRTNELSTAQEHLRQAQKMEAIGTLAGGIAHDFNNALSAIIGYSELAQLNQPDDSISKEYLEHVLTAADRAKEMIKQILTFSRKEKKEKKEVIFSNLINETVIFLRSTLPATIDISIDIQKDMDPIMANPTQLHQVIMNICTNAAQAMKKKGGQLKIELKEILHTHENGNSELDGINPGKCQNLSITDNGPGMSQEVLERIFEPYFTTKDVGEGTGMGLAVVHGIVKDHHGDIIVNSKPGKGTTVQVILPVLKKESPQETESSAETTIRGNGEHILFVDDEPMLAEMGKLILRKLGYRVTTYNNSLEALSEFRKNLDRYDLLVMDMTMPHMTGMQLAQECKKIRTDIPVVLCTGFSELINEKNFEALGIDAYVQKPLNMTELAKAVRETLDKK